MRTSLVVVLLVAAGGGCDGPRGPAGGPGAPGDMGDPGDPGAPGDSSARLYGDGSAGDATLTGETTLDDTNLMYGDFTVEEGATISIPSGAVIRCSGSFVNRGTIVVLPTPSGGHSYYTQGIPGGIIPRTLPPHSGVALQAAEHGELARDTSSAGGGYGGRGMAALQASQLLHPGMHGGGGGAGSLIGYTGGNGGGSLVVIARASLSNPGLIRAGGDEGNGPGAGGGAGGVVILASAGTLENAGTIQARGADGSDSAINTAAGGGGGGGIVHLIGPDVSNEGGANIVGGLAGSSGAAGSVTGNPRSGGGGGGACGGNGGLGGTVNGANDPDPAEDGGVGHVLVTESDPATML